MANPAADVPLSANPTPPPPCEVVAPSSHGGPFDSFVLCLVAESDDSGESETTELGGKRTVHPVRLTTLLGPK